MPEADPRRFRILACLVLGALVVGGCGATLPFYLSGRMVRAAVEARYGELARILGPRFRPGELEYHAGIYRSRFNIPLIRVASDRHGASRVTVQNAVSHGWFSARVHSRFAQRDWYRIIPGLDAGTGASPPLLVTQARIDPMAGGTLALEGTLELPGLGLVSTDPPVRVRIGQVAARFRAQDGRIRIQAAVSELAATAGSSRYASTEIRARVDAPFQSPGNGKSAHLPITAFASADSMEVEALGFPGRISAASLQVEILRSGSRILPRIRVSADELLSGGIPFVKLRELSMQTGGSVEGSHADPGIAELPADGIPGADYGVGVEFDGELKARSNYGVISGSALLAYAGSMERLTSGRALAEGVAKLRVRASLPPGLAALLARTDGPDWQRLVDQGILRVNEDQTLLDARLLPNGTWGPGMAAPGP